MQNKLSKDWTIKALGEVCEIKSGKNQKNVANPNGKYPIYGSSGIFGYADEYICDENTTIIGRKGTINSPIYVTTKFWNVDTAFGLSVKEDLNSKFLYYFCLGFNFKKLDKSTTIPSLSKGDLLSIKLPVPSIEIQLRVVSKIEELFSDIDKGIEDLNIAQQQLKTYRQSVLKWAFEGKLTNENIIDGELPKGWDYVNLKDVSTLITKGASPKWQGINYTNDKSQVLFITSENVRENYIDISKPKYLESAFNDKQKRSILNFGDILINIVGASIGRAAIFNLKTNANINQAVSVVRLNEKVNNVFVSYFLNSNKAFSYYNLNKVDVARANLSLVDIGNIEFLLPTLEEQHRIVQEIESRLSVADKMEESINESLKQAEALRQSILKKAFSGEWV